MRSALIKSLMLAFGLVAGLAIVEAGMRLFSPVELRLMGTEIRLPHFRKYIVTVEDPRVLEPRIVHTKNALGFRGPELPKSFKEHLSIVAIGGSTTECYILGDGKDWPAVLGKQLAENFRDVWVNNAGLNGHTTLGHLRLMKQHIIALQPKVALFLAGLNDTSFEDNHARFDVQLDLSYEDDLLYRYLVAGEKWLSEHSHAIAFLYQSYRQWRASMVHDLDGRFEKDFARMAKDPPSEVDLQQWRDDIAKASFNGYLERLDQLISLARRNGIEPIFMTQPSFAGPGRDPVTGLALERLMKAQTVHNDVLNRKLVEFGRDRNVLVIDVASAMPKTSRHFYDLWHYTNEGSAAFAQIAYRQLCPFLAERFPEHVVESCHADTLSTAGR